MATTYTPIWRLAQLQPLDPTTSGTWGNIQEATMTLMEQGAVGITPIALSGTTTTLTTANNATDQARLSTFNFTGALSADNTVTIPNIARWGWAVNNTTGGHNVILQTASPGTTLTIPPGQLYIWQCDGSNNVISPPLASAGQLVVQSGGIKIGTAALLGSTANNGVSLTGTAGNDAASAGQVGEFVSSQVARSPGTAMGNGVAGNVTTLTLTAGDWDVWGNVGVDATATLAQGWISTTPATVPTPPNSGAQGIIAFTSATMTGALIPVGMGVLQLASTTTVYLGVFANFTGAGTCYGFIGARRRR